MNIRAAFLAQDAAQNADGTFMVWKGGIDLFQATGFPTRTQMVVVLRFEVDAREARDLYRLRIRAVQGGYEGPWLDTPMAFKEPPTDDDVSVHTAMVAMDLHIQTPGPGKVQAVVEAADGQMMSAIPSMPFQVVQAQSPGSNPKSPPPRPG